MRVIQFDVHGVAQPQGSSRAFVNRKTGRAIVTSSNPQLKDWRGLVAEAAREWMAGREPYEGACEVEALFFLPRPKSVKRPYMTVKPDADKLLRGLLDSITHVIIRDDAQVTDATARKRYVSDLVPSPVTVITIKIEEK